MKNYTAHMKTSREDQVYWLTSIHKFKGGIKICRSTLLLHWPVLLVLFIAVKGVAVSVYSTQEDSIVMISTGDPITCTKSFIWIKKEKIYRL